MPPSVIGATYLFGLLWQLPGRTAIGQGQFLAVAAMTVTLVSVFAVLLRTPGWSRRRWLWLAALAAANLFVVNMGTNAATLTRRARQFWRPRSKPCRLR